MQRDIDRGREIDRQTEADRDIWKQTHRETGRQRRER